MKQIPAAPQPQGQPGRPPSPPSPPALQAAILPKVNPKHAMGSVMKSLTNQFGLSNISRDQNVRNQFHQALQQDPRFAGSRIFGNHNDKMQLANGQVIDFIKDVGGRNQAFAFHREGAHPMGRTPPALAAAIAPQAPTFSTSLRSQIMDALSQGPFAGQMRT